MNKNNSKGIRKILLVFLGLAVLVVCAVAVLTQVWDISFVHSDFSNIVNPYHSIIAAALACLAGVIVFLKRNNHIFKMKSVHNS